MTTTATRSEQQVLDARGRVWAEMQSILDTAETEGRDLSGEEIHRYDQLEADLQNESSALEAVRANARIRSGHAARAGEFGAAASEGAPPVAREEEPGSPEARYSDAFLTYVRQGQAAMETEDRQVLRQGWVDGKQLRAQGVATGAAGGFTVPQGFRARMVETMKFFGAVRRVAEVITTETGAALPWPTNDDTANIGALLAENTQATEQDLTLGTNQLDAFMYTSKIVRVSFQLLQDSAFDLEPWLARKLGIRIGRIQNQHFTTGTGTAQPEGIQTNSVIGVTLATGNTTTITYDGLIDLIHSVDPAYRYGSETDQGPQSGQFMLSDTALGTLRKLKDSQGRPLWEPGLQVGQPDSLLGHRFVINNDMPVPAANVKSVLFGDFREGYVIRDVRDVFLLRLEERYADFAQVGFVSFARSDGQPQDLGAYKALRQSAT